MLHLAFAVGIAPLIFAAMSHFVPVLTRTDHPPGFIQRLPFFAQANGLLVVGALAGWWPRFVLHPAALIEILLAAALLVWMVGRAKRCLGSPHPGWCWYAAALAAFVLALAAVFLMSLFPADYPALRAWHLHLNLLGLVGLAALGTLPVLLPTALGKPDPEAAPWLRRRLGPVVAGVLAVAGGAACWWPGAVLGAAFLLVAAGGLLAQWLRRFGLIALCRDGAAAPLAVAVIGFCLLIVGGVAHGAGWSPARPGLGAWLAGFLLPLVTGALSQLLPVWRWPGPVKPVRGAMRAVLVRGGRWRGLLFLAAGFFLSADWPLPGGALLLLGLLHFAAGLILAVRVSPSAR